MADHATFSITLRDQSTESIDGADTYVHEKVMTTFYRTDNARGAVDCWSTAMASFRTDEILAIRHVEAEVPGTIDDGGLLPHGVQRGCNRTTEHAVDRRPGVLV